MVNNEYSSCDTMSQYWKSSVLQFLPYSSRLFGVWGPNNDAWTIMNPGCTNGKNLFGFMKQNKVGFAVWQFWQGSQAKVNAIATGIRSSN
jgi:hypothetical protein